MTVNTKKQQDFTHDRLCELLAYDDATGIFSWRVSRRGHAKVGDRAGRQHVNGYRYIKVDGLNFMEHRLAWFYCKGKWPVDVLDHRDRIKNNNRLSNLREASGSQNQFNRDVPLRNRVGLKGVSWCSTNQKWRATISAFGKRKTIGFFDDPEIAGAAYSKFAATLHGEFSNA